ncbi:MAG TPA: glycosyl hydrolase family 28-related protein [Puia sp.]|nr:glycosyl hydrolase family 28-related protein [Puia sp.]
MKPVIFLCSFLLVHFSLSAQKHSVSPSSRSFYTQRPVDSEAVYFEPGRFPIKADGRTDLSDALQEAINEVKTQHNFGILFIPAGKYLLSKTIYIPRAVRVIGYGPQRPEFILAEHAPGFQEADSTDKGKARYLFWFTNSVVKPGERVSDAGAGTFYSALSNVDITLSNGNPYAVAIRAHFAQHSFISHVDIHIGNGKAGLFDVGNEMEDTRFFGGDYGIYTTKPSPGWQFMMTDTYFEGQRKAAIRTQEAGLTIVRLQAKNCPEVIEINPNYAEKLFMEDSRFENISGSALTISLTRNASSQISLRNIDCRNVPQLISYRDGGEPVTAPTAIYKVKNWLHGLQMDSLNADPVINTISDIVPLSALTAPVASDIPVLPPMNTWVNLKTLGATGDGRTDDSRAIQNAIDRYATIYVPQGWYRVSETLKLKPNTVLIGLNPISTQFLLPENAEAFGGFGGPKALLESSEGGRNIVSGIGLSTGIDNPRAVACKWMAGAGSYLNDVKFIGGHGNMERTWKQATPQPKPAYRVEGYDPSWDTQYWSLWITNGGGGVFKDIWSANTYASAGVYISNTSTPGRIYALSVEHHVRNEIRFNRVSNWKVYALQLEEESRESTECQPMELEDCHDMVFANLYMFRVIRVNKPFPYSIRNWNSFHIELLNVHNYSQIKYTTSLPLYDVNRNTEVRPWEFNRLFIEKAIPKPEYEANGAVRLATGFEMPEGACSDSHGNIYFCESRLRHIYKWSAETGTTSLLADYHWEPLSLACDKNDQLLVVFKYVPKPGYRIHGEPEVFTNPPDAAGTSFSGWGNSGFGTLVYSVDPNNPDETIRLLEKKKMRDMASVHQAFYPAHRWRDSHDFNRIVVAEADSCFVAPDQTTIIPVVYDLARATCLTAALPGKPAYVSDEYDKRTVRLDTDGKGYLSNLSYFAEKGEFSTAVQTNGNVYIADGEIYIFDPSGKPLGTIRTPERPLTLAFGGKDGDILFFTGSHSLYKLNPPH